MDNSYTDEIIGVGLVAALIIYILGYFYLTLTTGTHIPTELPATIVGALAGYMRGMISMESQKKNESKECDSVKE